MPTHVQDIIRSTSLGLQLPDEHGRTMKFPRRQDYVSQLQRHGLIADESGFVNDDHLAEAVYLDWLRRPQVGCIFAQLFARPVYRSGLTTVVARGSSSSGDPSELAIQTAQLVNKSVNEPSTEALSVLLPQVLDPVILTHFVWELSRQPGWFIEREQNWRQTLVLIGLRVKIANDVVAETLGMGPFEIFPTTRQCPVSTIEIRTKRKRAKPSHLSKSQLAAHLADIDTSQILTPAKHGALRRTFTPWLRKRVLGYKQDMRAKAGVTYSLPAAIWSSLRMIGA